MCLSSESDVSLTTHRPLNAARVHTISANAIAYKWQWLLVMLAIQCAVCQMSVILQMDAVLYLYSLYIQHIQVSKSSKKSLWKLDY